MRQHLLRQSAEFTAGIRVHDGPKTGNRRRLPRAHRNRSGRRGPAKAIRQAPEAMQPKSGGGNRRKGDRRPKSGAEPTARQLTAGIGRAKVAAKGDRQPKIRCGTHRKTIDHQKPDEQKSLQRRSATKIQCGTHCKTVDNRKPGGQSRCKTIDSRQPVCRNH